MFYCLRHGISVYKNMEQVFLYKTRINMYVILYV